MNDQGGRGRDARGAGGRSPSRRSRGRAASGVRAATGKCRIRGFGGGRDGGAGRRPPSRTEHDALRVDVVVRRRHELLQVVRARPRHVGLAAVPRRGAVRAAVVERELIRLRLRQGAPGVDGRQPLAGRHGGSPGSRAPTRRRGMKSTRTPAGSRSTGWLPTTGIERSATARRNPRVDRARSASEPEGVSERASRARARERKIPRGGVGSNGFPAAKMRRARSRRVADAARSAPPRVLPFPRRNLERGRRRFNQPPLDPSCFSRSADPIDRCNISMHFITHRHTLLSPHAF